MNVIVEISEGPLLLQGLEWEGGGSVVRFEGRVRPEENGRTLRGLDYESYSAMAEKILNEIISGLAMRDPVISVLVRHRVGFVPVGEASLFVEIQSNHRGEGFQFLADLVNELKRDVPIWKHAVYEDGP